MMADKKRILALVTALAVLLVMLFSYAYIADNFGHDCCGEHCLICYNIGIFQNTLKLLSVAVTVAVITAALLYTVRRAANEPAAQDDGHTLISLKVELLN